MFIKKEEFKEVKIIPSILVYFLLSFFISLIFFFSNDNNIDIIEITINSIFILFLLYKFEVNLTKFQNLIRDYFRKIKITEIIDVLFTQTLLSLGANFIILALLCFIDIDTANEINNTSNDIITATLASFIAVVIIAPIVEELFFRVVCFRRISKFLNVYVGMIVSSIFFGVLHIELAIVGAIFFGIANCILYLKYRNILIPMTIHFLNNFISSLSLFISSEPANNSEVQALTQADISFSLKFGVVFILIGGILFIRFIFKNRKYIESDAFDAKSYNFNSLF